MIARAVACASALVLGCACACVLLQDGQPSQALSLLTLTEVKQKVTSPLIRAEEQYVQKSLLTSARPLDCRGFESFRACLAG